jgi:hypothetical protein
LEWYWVIQALLTWAVHDPQSLVVKEQAAQVLMLKVLD